MQIKEITKSKKVHIFDMDGTLVNLEELNKYSYATTIEKYFKLKLSDNEYQAYFSGTKTAKGFELFIDSKRITDYKVDELVSDFRKRKEDLLKHNFNTYVMLIPYAEKYLKQLKEDGKTIVLATSTIKSFTQMILEKLNISQYFDLIITAEDVILGQTSSRNL
jgi:beta-phosphoglucomutase-like phosphatase (HAD superfamily)